MVAQPLSQEMILERNKRQSNKMKMKGNKRQRNKGLLLPQGLGVQPARGARGLHAAVKVL
jgi:hypothetical protein